MAGTEAQKKKRTELHVIQFPQEQIPQRKKVGEKRLQTEFVYAPERRRRDPREEERLRRLREQKLRRRRKRRRQVMLARCLFAATLLLIVGLACTGIYKLAVLLTGKEQVTQVSDEEKQIIRKNKSAVPEIQEDLLTINEYSRPGEPLPEVNNIFIHYTANPETSAAQNRSYFQNLATTKERSASAHFIIGYEGEILQIIPRDEIAYAVMHRNYDSISIECCYLQEDGKFTPETYASLIKLTAWLLKEYDLPPSHVLRHYDEGGKLCPKYYVENEGEWEKFLNALTEYIKRS